MILRKPYAFLIKYFKIIHLVLTVLLVYIGIRIYNIYSFFNDYVNSGLSGTDFSGSYINIFMYLSIIIILVLTITIYVLFKEKKKPKKYYSFLIIYYVFLFIYITIIFLALKGLENTEMVTRTIRAYRDISLIVLLPQLYFICISLVRGIGFNVKKFEFSKDIQDLEIEDTDNEEVELRVKIPGYKIKRTIRRFFRELKYYILENKILSIGVFSVFLIIVVTFITINAQIYSKVYKESQNFSITGWKFNVVESNLTPFDYNGRILKNDKYYLTVLLNTTNISNVSQGLTLTNFIIRINNDNIYPAKAKNEYFIDLGEPYLQQEVNPGETREFLIIYEIAKNELLDSYTFRVEDNPSFVDGTLIAKYKETILNPTKKMEIEDVSDYALEEEIPLNYSPLNKSTVSISNYSLTKSYKYNYEFCSSENKCYTSTDVIDATFQTETNKILMIFDYNLLLDKNAFYTRNIKSVITFFDNFLTIKYKVGTNNYLYHPINKSATNLPNKLILEVSENIKEASKIDILLTIRNKRYTIKVK